MSGTIDSQELTNFLQRLAKSFVDGDRSYFNNFASDAAIAVVHGPKPISTLDEYRGHFRNRLEAEKRGLKNLNLHIRINGDTANVTAHNLISGKRGTRAYVASLQLRKRPDGAIKIVQLHSSPVAAIA
jgi:ketosteroid isomerase-like protein